MKNFSPEAVAAYAQLIGRYIVSDEVEAFHKDFEKFLDACDNDATPDAYENDATPDAYETDATPNDFPDIMDNTVAKVAEIYRDGNGKQYIVVRIDDAVETP